MSLLKKLQKFFVIVMLFSVTGCTGLWTSGGLNLPKPEFGWIPQAPIEYIVIEIDGQDYEGKFMIRQDVDMLNVFISSCQD